MKQIVIHKSLKQVSKICGNLESRVTHLIDLGLRKYKRKN